MPLEALVVWLLVLLWEPSRILLLEHLVARVDAVHDHPLQLDEVSIKLRSLGGAQVPRLNVIVVSLAGNRFVTSDLARTIDKAMSIFEGIPLASFREFLLSLLSDLVYQVDHSEFHVTLVILCFGFITREPLTFEAVQSSDRVPLRVYVFSYLLIHCCVLPCFFGCYLLKQFLLCVRLLGFVEPVENEVEVGSAPLTADDCTQFFPDRDILLG